MAGFGIVVMAVNLRPAIVAVGPLSDQIRDGAGMGSTATALLTTVPLACLGVFAVVAPPMARRYGFVRTAVLAMAAVAVGSVVRLIDPQWALFVGTTIAGAGIAVANVVIPGLIKRDHPERLGLMMAVYSLSLQGGATLAAGVAVPLADQWAGGWHAALAFWGIPAAVAVVVWAPRIVSGGARSASLPRRYAVWRSGVGASAVLYMGMQSGVFYSVTAWMPSLLTDAGLHPDTAGLMLSVVGVTGMAGGVVIPMIATRMRDQRHLVIPVATALAAGVAGLIVAPATVTVLWAMLLGLGQGAALALGLTIFILRARTTEGAAELSGMGQAGGYLIASTGPLLIGATHDLTGTWTAPLVILLLAIIPMLAAGHRIGIPRFVEDVAARHSSTTNEGGAP